MSFPDKLLEKISTKGEIGVAALGFVLGYLIDLKIAFGRLTPAVAGVLGSTAAIGLKNTAESIKDFATERWAPARKVAATEKSVEEVLKLSSDLGNSAPYLTKLARRVRADRELWRKGLLDEDALKTSIEDFVLRYRAMRADEEESEGESNPEPPIRQIRLTD